VDHDDSGPLREQLRAALRSAARWRAVACALAVVVALGLAAGVAGGLTLAYSWAKQREAEERERRRLEELQTALARSLSAPLDTEERAAAPRRPSADLQSLLEAWDRLERAKEEERRRDALAPVAGGLGVAALDPGDD
jgi:hypothetical protein